MSRIRRFGGHERLSAFQSLREYQHIARGGSFCCSWTLHGTIFRLCLAAWHRRTKKALVHVLLEEALFALLLTT